MSRVNREGSRLLGTIMVFAVFFAADRTAFVLRDRSGSLCPPTAETTKPVEEVSIAFDIAIPCFATGIKFTEGDVYRFDVTDPEWHDGSLAANAAGVARLPITLILAGPSRRHVFQPWLKLVGRVGQAGNETFAIGSGLAVYKANATGELFLYVNDAVIGLAPGRFWAWPYYWRWGKNEGRANVIVSPVHTVDYVP